MTPFRWLLVTFWIGLGVYAGIADDWQLVPEASSSRDVTEIREVVTHDTLVADPSDCTELETERLVMQGEEGTYEEALAECREEEADEDDALGPTLDVSEIEVDGDEAHATANAPDGRMSMFTFRLDLVRESGRWKIDYISGVEIDRPAFDALMAQRADDSRWTAAELDCILSHHRAVPTEEIERSFVEEGEHALEDDLREFSMLCMRGTRLTQVLSAVLHERAVEDGVPVRYADCFTRQFLSRVPRARIRDLLVSGRPLPSKYCTASARACATKYPAAALAAAAVQAS
jgi:hypothetical protein